LASVFWFCAPCNVRKIAWGSVGKISWCVKLGAVCPTGFLLTLDL
jgi:hypothetical protein